jgi:hypothetical protein
MFFGGDPFEHFASHHGGGGGGRGRGRSPDVDTTKLYEVLGVSWMKSLPMCFLPYHDHEDGFEKLTKIDT